MIKSQVVEVGDKVRVDGAGCEGLFRGRAGTLVGYTRCGWAQVRLDDAGPWESSISAERDETTGLPIVLVFPGCLRVAEPVSGSGDDAGVPAAGASTSNSPRS